MKLLEKIIFDHTSISKEDVYDELYEMCDREHSTCSPECLVFLYNDYKIPLVMEGRHENCSCFKDGKKMFEFLEQHKEK